MTLAARVQQLVAAYREIAATRMAGVPLCHPGLRVEAVRFGAVGVARGTDPGTDPDARRGAAADAALGVLVTPWFMNLVWLPGAADVPLAVGATRLRTLGTTALPFIGSHEDAVGPFEACSLFSPMGDFADHATALAVAEAVLEELRRAPASRPPAQPSRRAFFTGKERAARTA